MNPEVKAAWLTALRSGEYRQGDGKLRDESRFCCLGVLCDIHAKVGLGHWDDDDDYNVSKSDFESVVLPQGVINWAGLPDWAPDILEIPLSVYNDGDVVKGIHPHTFAEIADLIEVHL